MQKTHSNRPLLTKLRLTYKQLLTEKGSYCNCALSLELVRRWDYNYNFYENDTEAAKSTEAAAKGKEAHPAPADMIHLSSFEVLILPLGMEEKMLFVIGGEGGNLAHESLA